MSLQMKEVITVEKVYFPGGNVTEQQPGSWRRSSTGRGADGVAGRRRTSEPDPDYTRRL